MKTLLWGWGAGRFRKFIVRTSGKKPGYAPALETEKKLLNYLDYLRGKDEDSIVKQALQISIDLHHNGKTSFYSNLMKMVDYYDLNYDFSCNSLSDSIVNRYIGIIKNKYVSYWNQNPFNNHKNSVFIVQSKKTIAPRQRPPAEFHGQKC